MNFLFFFLVIQLIIHSSSNSWSTSNKSFTELQSIVEAFIGYHNDLIYIIGGHGKESNLIKFDLAAITINQTTTSYDFGAQRAQSSIQINHELWMLALNQQILNVYDLENENITKTISFIGDTTGYRCITNYNEYILVIGGTPDKYNSNFYIYNISKNSWSTGPGVNIGRSYHSCNVVGNEVYVIAGIDYGSGTDPLSSIEYLIFDQVNGILDGWKTMEQTLYNARANHRSVIFSLNIYVIGGAWHGNTLSPVEIINTVNKTVNSPSGFNLLYATYGSSVIIVDSVIYCFGGYPTESNEYYQYLRISTPSPTSAPSSAPTQPPSFAPTQPPSESPTRYPTIFNQYDKKMEA
eukprot:384555_1